MEEFQHRQDVWERGLEARRGSDKRFFGGVVTWFGDKLGISWNCYVEDYPKLGGACASSATPCIRAPGSSTMVQLILEWYKFNREFLYQCTKIAESLAVFRLAEKREYSEDTFAINSNFPKIGVAFSRGGLRAILSGAGVFNGLDSGSTTAKPNLRDGKPTLNGLLDWATYMTSNGGFIFAYLGLSGGSQWLITASAQNGYTTIDNLRPQIWGTPQIVPDFLRLWCLLCQPRNQFPEEDV
jgi:Lysophospholipase catalytic domain